MLFCRQHDPVAVKAKNDARHEKWEVEWAARTAASARAEQERKALQSCREAMEKIAAGHNDPRALAHEVLALFPP